MKTKEFIRQVENLYLKVHIDLDSIKISCAIDGIPVAAVSKNRKNKMNTRFITFNSLDIEKQNKLFNLLVEYASTPIEERKEEKKYHIKMKCLEENHSYLNKGFAGGWYIQPAASIYKTQFTLKELPDWVHEMLEQGHLVKEEVE